MKKLFSLIVILVALLALGAAKVLLMTDTMLGIAILGGCGLFFGLCWFFYPKINKLYKE